MEKKLIEWVANDYDFMKHSRITVDSGDISGEFFDILLGYMTETQKNQIYREVANDKVKKYKQNSPTATCSDCNRKYKTYRLKEHNQSAKHLAALMPDRAGNTRL